ncbi:metallophosphoesterase [Rubritalea tangerina]|uniref:Metallophosphoesterase n=2 Tax=Rubritalea tangerina TaxID=430798 RepID=A0ABW4ZGE9_9BACT
MERRHFVKLMLPAALIQPLAAQGGASKPLLRFGAIADPQYADKDMRRNRFYRKSPAKLEKAITALNKHPLDFVVTLGDMIDCEFESFGPMMERYARLRVPHYKVYGNHDFEVADADKGKVAAAMEMPELGYYAVEYGGWKLLFLDGTELSTYRYPSKDPRTVAAEAERVKLQKAGVVSALSWNGGMSKAQFEWLQKVLDQAEAAGQKVIVMNHFPILPEGDRHNLWNAEQLLERLDASSQVVAYMNGHNHKGGYVDHKGVHYVNFKGMVESAKETAYAVVSCYSDRIEIEGFGAEPDRKLKL